ncbi:MAG: LuxR C-terminal-related transcriptional regulator [Bacteroidota bacterium]
MTTRVSVVIIEDNNDISKALQEKVNQIAGFQCEHAFAGPKEFLESGDLKPDIILLDLHFPNARGLDYIEPITDRFPEARVVINSILDDTDTIFSALKRGALGYIDKQSIDINFEEVLRIVSDGGGYMTPSTARKVMQSFRQPNLFREKLTSREKDITTDVINGLSYKMIAEKNHISIETVRSHIKNIYRKLKVNSRSQLFGLSKSDL